LPRNGTTTSPAIKARKRFVSRYLLVADTYPDMLQGASSDLLKRRSGKAVLTVERW
jgi:hypothetical protein